MRHYALERVHDPHEEQAGRRRHGEYYLELVEQAVPQLSTPGGDRALRTLESDIDNIHAAVRWAKNAAPSRAVRLVGKLDQNWWIVGSRAEAEELLGRALGELDPLEDPRHYAMLLWQIADLQWALNQTRQSLETAHQALAMLPSDPPSHERASLLSWLARRQVLCGRFNEAARDARETIAVAVAARDRRSESTGLNTFGMAQIALGQVDEGAARLREALGPSASRACAKRWSLREEGDLRGVAVAYVNLADLLHLAGRTDQALRLVTEGVAAVSPRLAGDREFLMLTASQLSFDAGDWSGARAYSPRSRGNRCGIDFQPSMRGAVGARQRRPRRRRSFPERDRTSCGDLTRAAVDRSFWRVAR